MPYGEPTIHGKMVRFKLADFSTDSVDVLDLTLTDANAKGMKGGFSDGRFGYAVPHVRRRFKH